MTTLSSPNYTQIPNELLDNMAAFSDAEWRVILCICRQTFGWQRAKSGRLLLDRIAALTGMSQQGVLNALNGTRERKGLLMNGLVGREECEDKGFVYWLVLTEELPNGVDPTALGRPNGVGSHDPTALGVPYKVKKSTKESTSTSQLLAAGAIYDLYPRKAGRPKALQAILKALKATTEENLSLSVKQFAKCWQGVPKDEFQFCPHPATWFNQERYNDDPSTWQRKSNGSTHRPEANQMQEHIEAKMVRFT